MTGGLSSDQMTHSQEEFSIHLSQAINYLHSPHRHIKTWAALFIGGQHGPGSLALPTQHHSRGRGGVRELGGFWKLLGAGPEQPASSSRGSPSCTGYTTCYQPQAVSQMVNDMDTRLLFSSEQPTPWACLHTSQLSAASLSQMVKKTRTQAS